MNFEEAILKLNHNQEVYVREWSPAKPEGYLVILIHGLSDHGGRFIHTGSRFAENGHVFMAPDLPGNGRTGGKRGHLESYEGIMDWIGAVTEAFREKWPHLPVILYGQSMGGNLALNYCLRKQPDIAGAVISSPWLRLANPPSRMTEAAGLAIGRLFPSLTIPDGIRSGDLCHSETVCKAYDDDPLVHGRISLNTYRIITQSGEWAIRNAGLLNCPVLLMHGSSDRITSHEASRLFAIQVPGKCTFRTWQGLFHELHNEPQSPEVLEYVLNWMSSLV